MHRNAIHRFTILNLLYLLKERMPLSGWLSEEEIAEAFGEGYHFHLNVLLELNWIKESGAIDKRTYYQITGAGVLAFEAMEIAK